MSTDTLKPRPVPFLKTFFDAAADGMELYGAPVIDPVSDVLAEYERYSFMEPKVAHAFKNDRGDILFQFDVKNWYVLPAGAKEACKMGRSGFAGSSDKFDASFSCELPGEEWNAAIKFDKEKGEAGIKASVGKKAGFTVEEIKELTPLSDKEKDDLLASLLNREISFIGLPDFREVEQALQKMPNGDYLIVSCSKTDYAYETLRMFTGPSLDNLREIKVNNVERYKDGGTTFYYTDEGILYSPTTFEREQVSTKWLPGATETGGCDYAEWQNESHPAEKLARLDTEEFGKELGLRDARIRGIKTWAELNKGSGPA